ncbi:hypothetical protein [uncultured Roseobacter sp.]|uniref:hypothetical protein n=1 Tax=uncultured Roseobacter sp. TaxID=114847 RepID=UPI002617C660|nr:hypothetical protein [uncultured Roseobacter sp.]
MTRRTFVAAVPALGLASPLAAWPLVSSPSTTKPVLHVAHVGSAAEAKERIDAVRHAPGCMRADVFAASDGRFAIFQTWVSESAAARFNGEGMKSTPALERFEF